MLDILFCYAAMLLWVPSFYIPVEKLPDTRIGYLTCLARVEWSCIVPSFRLDRDQLSLHRLEFIDATYTLSLATASSPHLLPSFIPFNYIH